MLIEGIDDEEPAPNNQNSNYRLDESTVYRAPPSAKKPGHEREDSSMSSAVRSSVILPKPSGKEKKKGYFSGVVKSLKALNKYIYKTKAKQAGPQQSLDQVDL